MKNIYSNMYSSEKNLNLGENPRIKIMADIINGLDLQGENILDIGCHDGVMLSLVKNRKNNFFGIEADGYGAQKCREKGIEVAQVFLDDKNPFPFEDRFFDVVIAGEIIEHIYDTDFFLEEIARILKPGGKLLISTPNIASFGRRIMLLCGINPIIEISPNESDSSGHIRYFVFLTLKNLLEKHNFKMVKCRSDIVNFSSSGRLRSCFLASIFPAIGQSIICLLRKNK
jgi:methionine biosynthesis protein MetW